MLTETEYNDMWDANFARLPIIIGGTHRGILTPPTLLPPYHEYLQREVYKQDYLDMFGVAPTYTRIINFIGGVHIYGVPLHDLAIPGPGGAPVTPRRLAPYTQILTDLAGAPVDCLIVDYKHPFIAAITNPSKRTIKYILIGEAPNEPKPRSGLYGTLDRKNTFFYNVHHVSFRGGYFTAPCQAFGILNGTKIEKLIQLADNGVLLIDLFPFAINYGKKARGVGEVRPAITLFAEVQFRDIIAYLTASRPYKYSKKIKFSFLCAVGHADAIINSGIRLVGLSAPINILSDDIGVWITWTARYLLPATLTPLIGVNNWHGLTHPITINDTLIAGNTKVHKYKSIGKTIRAQRCPPHEINIRFSLDL